MMLFSQVKVEFKVKCEISVMLCPHHHMNVVFLLQMIGLPSKTLGIILCHYVGSLNVDISVELSGGASDCPVNLDEVCKRALALEELRGTFQQGQLTRASDLIASLDLNWRKLDLARYVSSYTICFRNPIMIK